jgi:hypothetical protein
MKVNIRELMNNIEDSSVQLEEQNVVSAERIKELTKMKINGNGNTVKHNSKKKVVTVIIAAAVVSAMGISAYAAFKGGLEGVAFGQPTGSTESTEAEMTRYPELDPAKNQMISLQGYSDTDEYKASKEWREFEDNYDKDWSICDAYDKECKRTKKDPFEEKYPGYGIYSQEMADKADELIKKYNLKLRGKMLDMDINEKVLQEKFGDIWTGIVGAGYCYEDGTFSLDADYEKVSFQIRRVMKGSFDTVYLNVGQISSYEQWTYKTKCGVEVSIALNNRGGVVLANTPKGFVAINLCENWDEDGNPMPPYTKAQIEDLADHINFNNL